MKNSWILLLLFFTAKAFSFELPAAHYQLIKGDESLCSSGPAKILKEEGEETFILGSIISIPLIKEKTIERIADGKCFEVDELVRSAHKLVFTSVIKDCSKEFAHLEKKVTQTVTIKGKELVYQLVSGDSVKECLFRKEIRE